MSIKIKPKAKKLMDERGVEDVTFAQSGLEYQILPLRLQEYM